MLVVIQAIDAGHLLQSAPIAYDGSTVVTTSSGLVSSIGITDVQFSIAEPKSSYTYQLSATPAAGASTSQTNLGNPTTGSSCGFALPGTGATKSRASERTPTPIDRDRGCGAASVSAC